GVLDATVKAVEAVDECLGKIYFAITNKQGILIVTADHGNAECKIDPETQACLTAHTSNQVPFILVGEKYKGQSLRPGGSLQDVAPTILDIMHIDKPPEMTGTSLLQLKL
ncbi:MAG TPA: 2,3-bisphosphoglycerate-independent phosphoglycerate mutase, partial [Verrucomicrobiae bacterium]|nr:2,3-bisphosphoglycerate-independent phosphoglycerate mutase [Verrucomicrobiae bacterium]